MQRFSRRTNWNTEEGTLAAAIRVARQAGRGLCDLTVSNPTICGFRYDLGGILQELANPRVLRYDADPLGMPAAREAVCGYYRDHGAEIGPGRVVLAASTSEAYGWLFRLLCDTGDEVLVPQPGYPLFDYLADLEDVCLRTYPLFFDYGWWIDFHALERSISERTKAIVVVHPANPTGHLTRPEERARLINLCARHGLALIVDEVFLDYGVAEAAKSFVGVDGDCSTFVLSGLSKVAALPQMKVGWVVAGGEGAGEAMRRLEVVADTFLSVGGPAQWALPGLLAGRQGIQEQIRARVRENLRSLAGSGLACVPFEAGWNVVARVGGELGGAEQILEERGVVVHPGSFYGLAGPGRVVLSLIGDPGEFVKGIRLLTSIERAAVVNTSRELFE